MTFDVHRVEAVTFDSFSTLVDPISAASALDGLVDDQKAIARRWHPLAVRYATVANHLDAYATYFDLHRDAIDYLLRERGIFRHPDELAEITAVYHDLEPFDDVRETFDRVTDAGLSVAILSNGDSAMLESLVQHTGTRDLVDMLISADEIRKFKPAAELYEHAADRLDVPLHAIAHVGAGWGDVQDCVSAGLQGVWVDRTGNPWPTFGPKPDLIVGSLNELADRLGA